MPTLQRSPPSYPKTGQLHSVQRFQVSGEAAAQYAPINQMPDEHSAVGAVELNQGVYVLPQEFEREKEPAGRENESEQRHA